MKALFLLCCLLINVDAFVNPQPSFFLKTTQTTQTKQKTIQVAAKATKSITTPTTTTKKKLRQFNPTSNNENNDDMNENDEIVDKKKMMTATTVVGSIITLATLYSLASPDGGLLPNFTGSMGEDTERVLTADGIADSIGTSIGEAFR